MTRSTPLVLELDHAAAALLDLLVELGHLDERLLAMVNDRLLDVVGEGEPGATSALIGIQDVKRVAAEVIAEHLEDTDPEYQRAVEREWPLLFH